MQKSMLSVRICLISSICCWELKLSHKQFIKSLKRSKLSVRIQICPSASFPHLWVCCLKFEVTLPSFPFPTPCSPPKRSILQRQHYQWESKWSPSNQPPICTSSKAWKFSIKCFRREGLLFTPTSQYFYTDVSVISVTFRNSSKAWKFSIKCFRREGLHACSQFWRRCWDRGKCPRQVWNISNTRLQLSMFMGQPFSDKIQLLGNVPPKCHFWHVM